MIDANVIAAAIQQHEEKHHGKTSAVSAGYSSLLTDDDVRTLVMEGISDAGSQKKYSDLTGLSTAYINDYVQFRREPGPKILEYLGLAKINRYQRVKL